MSDATTAAVWAAALVATGAALGVHPAAGVTAGRGGGGGRIVSPGRGGGPAIRLAALRAPMAPLVGAGYVAEHAASFAAPLSAQCVIACGLAAIGPVALRVGIEVTPAVVRAAADRLVRIVGGGK